MTEGDTITAGRMGDKDAAIIHLEYMKYDKEYPILIKGMKFKMKMSNDNHIWFWESDN